MTLNGTNICKNLDIEHVELENPFFYMFEKQVELQKRVGSWPLVWPELPFMIRQIIYWEHCIAAELTELLEWEADMKEIQMEAIDILHFVMNIGVELSIHESMCSVIEQEFKHSVNTVYDSGIAAARGLELVASITKLVDVFPWKTWKKYPDINVEAIINSARDQYVDVYMKTLKLCNAVGLDRQDIVNFYMAKNKENHARQDRGYTA